LLAMSASVAGAAGIAGIDSHHRDTVELSFVFEKAPQLEERPSAHLRPLLFAEPSPITDATEVFNGDAASGVFGAKHKRFADNVILVAAEAGFLRPDPLHGPAGVLAGSSFVLAGHLPPEGTPDAEILLADGFNSLPGDDLPVAGGDDLFDAEIDTKKLFDLDGSLVRQVNGAKKVELPVAIDKIALTLDPVKSRLLVFAEHDREQLPTFQREQADAIHAFETHQPLIVGHGPVGLEFRTSFSVPLKTLNCLTDGTDSHLTRQAELLPMFAVAEFVDTRLAEPHGLE